MTIRTWLLPHVRDWLTDRERDALRLAQRGLPNPQIVQALHLWGARCATT